MIGVYISAIVNVHFSKFSNQLVIRGGWIHGECQGQSGITVRAAHHKHSRLGCPSSDFMPITPFFLK